MGFSEAVRFLMPCIGQSAFIQNNPSFFLPCPLSSTGHKHPLSSASSIPGFIPSPVRRSTINNSSVILVKSIFFFSGFPNTSSLE